MAVLVTRPAPDNERSAETLRARGFEVLLAPMLVFKPLPFQCDAGFARGVLLTSANGARAVVCGIEFTSMGLTERRRLEQFIQTLSRTLKPV